MKLILGGMLALLGLHGTSPLMLAQTPEPPPAAATASPASSPFDSGKRAREFQGDDLGQVLRLLARQAKINLVVGEAVKGSVSMRLENASAMEAIEVLVRQYKLSLNKDDKGVYYVNLPDAADAALDFLTKLETAYRIAAYKHNLYTALIKQGFTPEDSLKIVAMSDPAGLIALDKKTAPPPAP